MKSFDSQRGFTVLELTVAALLTVGLLGVTFALVNRNQEVFTSETNMTDLNQNVRVAMDLLTRDLQTAGMGLSCPSGSMAAIYYVDGASGAADGLLILNADPYAPSIDVDGAPVGTTFTCTPTGDLTITGSGSSAQFTYLGANNATLNMFRSFSSSSKRYIVYDTTKARVMELTSNGSYNAGKVSLTYDSAKYANPPATFSTAMGGATVSDTGTPDYPNSRIAMLGTSVGYRVNANTNELERTEDLSNWYTVARGITNMQVRYRCITKDGFGATVETIETAPADRGTMRAIEVTLYAETADLPPTAKGYRRVVQRFEVSPRNFNLLNNTNLSSDVD